MFLLTIIKSPEFITLISGLIIAVVIFILYNSSYAIRKKTRGEAIQKLKLDSIMSVINETKEFKKATNAVEYEIGLVEERAGYLEEALGNEASQMMLKTYSQFEKVNMALSVKMENFIFLLNRDMIINGEYQNIKKEIKKIHEIEKLRTIINNGFIISSRWKEDADLNDDEYNLIYNVAVDLREKNPHAAINESIKRILKIYKKKLDKEQEDWLDKLLNCFKRR